MVKNSIDDQKLRQRHLLPLMILMHRVIDGIILRHRNLHRVVQQVLILRYAVLITMIRTHPIPNESRSIPQNERSLKHQRRHARVELQLRRFHVRQHPLRHDVLNAIGAVVHHRRDESHRVESQFGRAAEHQSRDHGQQGQRHGRGRAFPQDESGEEDGERRRGRLDGFDEGDGDVLERDEAEDDGEAAEDAHDGHVAYEVEAHSGR
mmetsp:Transcript_28217/g.53248  ORF Transcript_28217/g.53248 Transcript_28217/m.53248 type:complete len:207 (-) Transcript_28217:172-792(-)